MPVPLLVKVANRFSFVPPLVLSLPWELQRRLFFTVFVLYCCLFDALAPLVRSARAHRQGLGNLAIGRLWMSSK